MIEKNRGGEAGLVYRDVKFDNGTMQMLIEENMLDAADDIMS
jgi:hypothetical protein